MWNEERIWDVKHCSNIYPPMHFILILSLFISHSLKCVFLFLCMISLINRARHDRGLFYKEHLALSNLFLRWPELIVMVDMVNLAFSVLEALTLLEAFQVWAQKEMLLFWNVRGNLAPVRGGTRTFGARVFASVCRHHGNKGLYWSLLLCPLWN